MATAASTKNFQRQRENASQYASGIPNTSRIPATHAASLTESQSDSMRLLEPSPPAAEKSRIFAEFRAHPRFGETREIGARCQRSARL